LEIETVRQTRAKSWELKQPGGQEQSLGNWNTGEDKSKVFLWWSHAGRKIVAESQELDQSV
jgi:hypothetical protein